MDIHELVYDAKTWTTTSTLIVEDAGRAMLSPDGSHLFVHLDEAKKVAVMDLLTGEETTFDVPEDLEYYSTASVSPDSTGICYTTNTGKIYLQNIPLGKSWLVYKPQSANYMMSGTKIYVHGQTSCGPWIGQNRFVIYRYVGSMPSRVTFPGYHEVNANRTTVVTVSERPKLEDTRQFLTMAAVSADGLSVVYIDKKDGSAYIARDFSSFRQLESQLLAQLNSRKYPFFEFLPDNRLLYTGVDSFHQSDLNFPDYSIVDLESMEIHKLELPGDCTRGLIGGGWDYGAYHRTWEWVERAGGNTIACLSTGSGKTIGDMVFKIYVADLETDSSTAILTLETTKYATGGEIIGWLP